MRTTRARSGAAARIALTPPEDRRRPRKREVEKNDVNGDRRELLERLLEPPTQSGLRSSILRSVRQISAFWHRHPRQGRSGRASAVSVIGDVAPRHSGMRGRAAFVAADRTGGRRSCGNHDERWRHRQAPAPSETGGARVPTDSAPPSRLTSSRALDVARPDRVQPSAFPAQGSRSRRRCAAVVVTARGGRVRQITACA